jgi:hypothetical protein
LINKSLKDKIEMNFRELNYLPKQAQLDIWYFSSNLCYCLFYWLDLFLVNATKANSQSYWLFPRWDLSRFHSRN